MADRFMFLRMMAKEVARSHGVRGDLHGRSPGATAPVAAAHFNMSLADADDGREPVRPRRGRATAAGCGISELGYRFLAGVLAHAPAICAVTCPTVNSYKRLIRRGAMSGSTWAPVFISYGRNNRTHMLRVPTKSRPGRVPRRRHVVQRLPGRARSCSPPASRASSASSIPAAPIDRDMYVQSDDEIADLGVGATPANAGRGDRGVRGRPARARGLRTRPAPGLHRLQASRMGGLPQHGQPVGVGALPDLLLAGPATAFGSRLRR